MIYAYINSNISLSQINELYPKLNNSNINYDYMVEINGIKFNIEQTYEMKKFKKNENGKYIFPRYEEDAEEQLINDVTAGDIVITSTLTNFSTMINGMLRSLRLLTDKGVRVITYYEAFDSESDEGKALIQAIPVLQRFDRNCKNERMTRQREGVARAKKEGKYTTQGRKPITADHLEHYTEYFASYNNGEISKSEFARRLGVSRPTLDKLINENLRKGEN